MENRFNNFENTIEQLKTNNDTLKSNNDSKERELDNIKEDLNDLDSSLKLFQSENMKMKSRLERILALNKNPRNKKASLNATKNMIEKLGNMINIETDTRISSQRKLEEKFSKLATKVVAEKDSIINNKHDLEVAVKDNDTIRTNHYANASLSVVNSIQDGEHTEGIQQLQKITVGDTPQTESVFEFDGNLKEPEIKIKIDNDLKEPEVKLKIEQEDQLEEFSASEYHQRVHPNYKRGI